MIAVVIAEGIAIVLLGVLVVGLLRGYAQVLRTLHEAGLGDPAEQAASAGPQELPFGVHPGMALPRDNPGAGHDISGRTPGGDVVALRVTGAEHDTLVAFLSSGCLTCAHFWDAFSRGVTLPKRARLVIVTKGTDEESVSALRSLQPRGIAVVMSSEVWQEYSIPLAPYFVYIDGPSGKVRGEGAASTWDQVDNLMRQGLADQDAGQGQVVGGSGTGDGEFREARADRELMAAGIFPGHPSLYEPPEQVDLDQSEHSGHGIAGQGHSGQGRSGHDLH